MSVYRGHDVLDVTEPNRLGTVEEQVERKLALLDAGTGAVAVDAMSLLPTSVRSYRWTAMTRAETSVIRAFLDARHGRAVPFWLPTYQADMALSQQMGFATTLARVHWVGYTERVWAKGRGRRNVVIFSPPAGLSYHQVTNATHSPGAATEDLTVAPSAPVIYEAGTILMFLRYCRLDSDWVEMRWRGEPAEVELPIRELPLEEPA
ncbi:MAG: hypothetical protein A2V88_02660 [Elusimicrobia bacterium RBG_16_66_12]|nr:MAG: hypothetical protein A2V88_02660 [Elusimicrobia bacterium RBG_16_66_12]